MEKLFVTMMGLLLPMLIQSNDEVYLQNMQQYIEQLNASATIDQYQSCANAFERVSRLEADKWQPMYYVAYSYIVMSYQLNDNVKRDEILDKAWEWIDKLINLAPKESEVFVLQAFWYPSRIIVDPMQRGMHLMARAHESLSRAKVLNPDNPRIYYLEATYIHNSPPAMGGGVEKALPLYQLAADKFARFVPNSVIDPDWGEQQNRNILLQLINSSE